MVQRAHGADLLGVGPLILDAQQYSTPYVKYIILYTILATSTYGKISLTGRTNE